MKLIKVADRYIVESTYEEKDAIKRAGFRWDPDDRRWWASSEQVAANLVGKADMDADIDEALRPLAEAKQNALTGSRAKDAALDIPRPEGLDYMPFQKAGIEYAMNRQGTLIADEMGLGKTIQVLGLINLDQSIKNVLIICPASVKLNWRNEARRWLVRPMTVDVANGRFPKAQFVIVNYDILKKHQDALTSRDWDLAVADESHYLKNPKAQRTKLGIEILKGARRRILLTGTPILNRPIELFTQISLLDPGVWGSFWGYAKRYCDAHQETIGWGRHAKKVWKMDGASNLEELQERLRSTIMVRRLKADVLTDLPSKTRQVIEVAPNGQQSYIDHETAADTKWTSEVSEAETARDMADANEDAATYETAVARLQGIRKAMFTEMARLRHETALAKLDKVADHVREVLDSTDKVVVFAHHRDVIDRLEAELSAFHPVTLTGRDNITQRQQAIDRFQYNPDTRVFIGNIQAAGIGITLTAAHVVVFAELDWVPGNITQAEDRVHRIGQNDAVLVQHVVLDGSLDAKLARTLVDKQRIIDLALDTETAAPEVPEAKKPTNRTVSAEEIPLIHKGLRVLATLDPDRASGVNSVGFNKIDTDFGHSLAQSEELTPKQAWYGRRLLKKYHRQLPDEVYGPLHGL